MNKIRYLALLLLALAGSLAVMAQDDYNPADPADPGVPPQKLTLLVEPAGAGYVNGDGKIVPEATVQISALAYSNWAFVNWTDEEGNVVSTTRSFYHTKQDCAETFTAHFEYAPGNPADPVPGTSLVYYRLDVMAEYGGTASGGGRYQADTKVPVRAYPGTGFDFDGWYNEADELISTAASFSYTKQVGNETLTARFVYNPDAPNEPSDPILSHKVNTIAEEGGTATPASTSALSGNTVRLSASPNPGYKFAGWYCNGELYTSLQSFDYRVGDSNATFEARFVFNPDSPEEPSMSADKQYSIYLLSPITYPGRDVECIVMLNNPFLLRDMRFDLTFPEGMEPDFGHLVKGEGFEGYDITIAPSGEPCGYTLNLLGGQASIANRTMLRIPLSVPESTALGTGYQLLINQVSVTQEDGSTCTAGTRNGRVSVYKKGDTNGDGVLNILDRINLVGYVGTGTTNEETFIKEVSDVNEDGKFSILDVIEMSDLIATE